MNSPQTTGVAAHSEQNISIGVKLTGDASVEKLAPPGSNRIHRRFLIYRLKAIIQQSQYFPAKLFAQRSHY